MYKKMVVLLSGGLDSTVTGFLAKEQSESLYGLSIFYNQRHQREIESAEIIGKKLNLVEHVFFTLDLSQFGGSSLFSSSNETIPTEHFLEDVGKIIPSTYVPCRNTIFLTIALAYAETIDADAIGIGITATDYSGYPDCRPEFIKAFQYLITLATKKTVSGDKITLFTPLLYLTKSQIIKNGADLNVPFNDTWSCYQGKEIACGQCDSCLLRLKGFQEAGLNDPIEYIQVPSWYQKK